jgi:hypothetical protein
VGSSNLSGDQGLLGQIEGRSADDAAYWLACQRSAWRDAVKIVAIDTIVGGYGGVTDHFLVSTSVS